MKMYSCFRGVQRFTFHKDANSDFTCAIVKCVISEQIQAYIANGFLFSIEFSYVHTPADCSDGAMMS